MISKYKEPQSPKDKKTGFVAQRQWAVAPGRRRHLRPTKVALPLASTIILLIGGSAGFFYVGMNMTHASGNRPTIVSPRSSVSSTPVLASIPTLPVEHGAIASSQWIQDGSIETVYIDAAGHIQQLATKDGTNWRQTDLTRATGAAIANGEILTSYSWEKGSSWQIAYIDVLGHIHLLWSGDNSHWQVLDLTQRAGAPLSDGKSLLSYVWSVNDSQHIVYLDQQKHIQELVSVDGIAWQATDLTRLTNAPTPAGNAVSAFYWSKDQSQHIAYVAANKHVMELNSTGDGSWRGYDLTQLYGAPLANGNVIVGYEWQVTGTLLINYIDDKQHIQELLSTTSNAWEQRDLTTLTNRPLASGNSLAAYDWQQGNKRVIIYVDENKHIQELSLPPGERWQGIDLTQQASAPLASDTGLVGYDWLSQGNKVVVFVDTNHFVQSIIGTKNGNWRGADW
ncbi:hypothetical protein [Dictyobacter vulcani]|uniref:hypothetical protein n=1 Tax=Dictyobacter vulcani TaxID=2607529 RepID=UPI0013869268|nr:hypothetical protein [Dictyobacter vulcani]